MRIRVLFFGVLRETLACSEETLELAAPATAGSVVAHYRQAWTALEPLWPTVAVAVNRSYVEPGTMLAEDDEVALLPPVSGGAPLSRAWLTWEPIPAASIIDRIREGSDGAVLVFDGMVRSHSRGRQTLFLEYHAYEAMAEQQLRSLSEQATDRFAIREAILVHRLGRLAVGETSVLIVVAAAHRAAAFEACRWLIDTLKTTVPIWKKEYFFDGAVWADGEPFPPELARPATLPGAAR